MELNLVNLFTGQGIIHLNVSRANISQIWSRRSESNRLPYPYQGYALSKRATSAFNTHLICLYNTYLLFGLFYVFLSWWAVRESNPHSSLRTRIKNPLHKPFCQQPFLFITQIAANNNMPLSLKLLALYFWILAHHKYRFLKFW